MSRALLQQALDALEQWDALLQHQYTGSRDAMQHMHDAASKTPSAIAALRQALAQPALQRLADADAALGLTYADGAQPIVTDAMVDAALMSYYGRAYRQRLEREMMRAALQAALSLPAAPVALDAAVKEPT